MSKVVIISLSILMIVLMVFVSFELDVNEKHIIITSEGETWIDPECAMFFLNEYDCFDVKFTLSGLAESYGSIGLIGALLFMVFQLNDVRKDLSERAVSTGSKVGGKKQ